MEFPHLGEHCEEPTCRLLDFLPFRCDSCKKIFCKDHINYFKHSCEKAAERSKDFQVPLCPLCNTPVPYKRGELPDNAMSAHIDRDCKSDPAEERRRKIYSNKCSMKGCKQKELIPFTCQKCRLNYCIRHRHETDHNCDTIAPSARGVAGANDINNRRLMYFQNQVAQSQASNSSRPPNRPAAVAATAAANIQPGSMTESEAIEYAIRLSLNEAPKSNPPNRASNNNNDQESEDAILARVLAQSELEHRNSQQRSDNSDKKDQCRLQ